MAQNALPFKTILSYPNKTIAGLCLQINQQLTILQRIKGVLPKELADHALHCVFNDKKLNNKKLLLYTDSAIWASQLRFYGKTMLTAIESAVQIHVSGVQIKVINIPESANASPKPFAVIPSQTVVDEIRNHSLITTDPQLRTALDKLSSTLIRLQNRSG